VAIITVGAVPDEGICANQLVFKTEKCFKNNGSWIEFIQVTVGGAIGNAGTALVTVIMTESPKNFIQSFSKTIINSFHWYTLSYVHSHNTN
jgi:hypothetical protein